LSKTGEVQANIRREELSLIATALGTNSWIILGNLQLFAIFFLTKFVLPVNKIYLSRYSTSTRRRWRDLFGLRVKLPPVTTSL